MTPQAHRSAGFTLIELMIVVVIIGILAAIAIPKFNQVSRSSKEAEASTFLKQISTLQARYYQKHDTWAVSLDLLENGTTLVNGGKYYDFSVSPAGSCAIATPAREGINAQVRAQSMDLTANRTFEGTTCSGTLF